MPDANSLGDIKTEIEDTTGPPTSLPFLPITASHILACSFHSWHPKLRSVTPKARTIALTQPFLDYLRADGIVLPPDNPPTNDDDSGYSDSEDESDPSEDWQDVHEKIKTTIAELGGKVVPKLNWSAPKDATFMSATNDMECKTPNDIYLLLKSSDFITHDLAHAFDGCIDRADVPYHLVLRKAFNINPALEFRCFVRRKLLLAISQREMNHFPFLFELETQFKSMISKFLYDHILPNLSESNFVFDVYIPPPHDRVWLIDINPWAPRTDPLLFSWLEILQKPEPVELSDADDVVFEPDFRLVLEDDPEAYQFASTKYSAHKLPQEVVEAGMTPGGMKEMMDEWKRILDLQERDDAAS